MIDYNIFSKIVNTISDAKLHQINELIEENLINSNNIYLYLNAMYQYGIDISFKQSKYCYLKKPICLLNKMYIYKNFPKNKIFIFNIICSTNQYLAQNMSILNSGDICLAEYQTHGKGTRGKKWFASFGNNICLSMYWNIKTSLINLSQLSVKISQIVAKILINFGIPKIRIKFPNDIFIEDKKFAGILIETFNKKKCSVDIIIGIGINIIMSNIYSKLINITWTDLSRLKIAIDRNVLIVHIVSALHDQLKKIQNKYSIFDEI
ncbi:biotin-[acetylCoA carboxylase] holoenzyme synthetase/DNA-binding transcriptional repressor [Wigglesworthia glossinidia endosymbiont of Glossina morsitans morsitans (Yale colony)]|uniref:Biotin-[acetylCoA carboxylase] holoenzyme synthetase/DNA-binding transcriptional repressor n=1 Tax=Wigglesworthia glossinidia endosymbiont of Glossina morsitans morsitans (Yale colony) TaxID=1142511 RepID=H6Q4M4_WIGGL|nr:biotin--[acetyl-CoA-carboxylase] ligase [Wigglesworthia glossinidia]AFA41084.1 biotin-[acetylCoA carboxylase] holoenzyme synthetase/DNA-binding transcriptional repressor [Wigglesworthia glossinidia endosymbiont of Glossina morsitans morsitans (Yale colony)]